MKRALALVLTPVFAAALVVATPSAGHAKSPKAAKPVICPSYADSEFGGTDKIDTSGDPQTVTVEAPDGLLIGGYCVKGGLVTDIVTLEEPVESLDITVSNGKAVSHYSVFYVPGGGCEPYCS